PRPTCRGWSGGRSSGCGASGSDDAPSARPWLELLGGRLRRAENPSLRFKASPRRTKRRASKLSDRTTEEGVAAMMIRGERVYLRPIHAADFPHLVAWTNDSEISRLMDSDYPATLEECAEWHRAELGNRHSQRFAVCTAGE